MIINNKNPAEQITEILNRMIERGLTTSSGGNISFCTPDGKVWITPSATDKGNMNPSQIVEIDYDGTVHGKYQPSVESGFHCEIYKVRPDIHAVIHAHSAGLITFSCARMLPYTDLIENTALSRVNLTSCKGDMPGSRNLKRYVTEKFEAGYNAVLIENHGIVIGAENLYKAICILEELELSANIHLKALELKRDKDSQIMRRVAYKQNFEKKIIKQASDNNLCKEICDYIIRGFKTHLFSSSIGRISVRTGNDSFYINSANCDRREPLYKDIIEIINNCYEDKVSMLHKKIYEKNPQIQSIVSASPVNVMTIGVLPIQYETHYDLESCLTFEHVDKITYEEYEQNIDEVATRITSSSGAVIIQNEFALTFGKNIFNAFDKMEILENGVKYTLNFNNTNLKSYFMETERND